MASPVSSEKVQHLPLGRPHPGESSVAQHSGGTGWGHRVFSGPSSEPGTPPPTRLEGMKRKNIQTHKHPYLAPFLFCSKTSGHLSGSSLFFFSNF